MSDFEAVCEEGERISREEAYQVLTAEIAALHARIESLERKISRIGGVLVDVLEWADRTGIQPPWLDALTAAVEDKC